MLKIRRFLRLMQNTLIIVLLLATASMFFIRYKMYDLSRDLAYLDKHIESLQDHKELLDLELTYLTSTERILSLIDKNPNILNNKKVINVAQLKSKKQLIEISLAKANNRVYENRKLAESKINNDLVEREL